MLISFAYFPSSDFLWCPSFTAAVGPFRKNLEAASAVVSFVKPRRKVQENKVARRVERCEGERAEAEKCEARTWRELI